MILERVKQDLWGDGAGGTGEKRVKPRGYQSIPCDLPSHLREAKGGQGEYQQGAQPSRSCAQEEWHSEVQEQSRGEQMEQVQCKHRHTRMQELAHQ